MFSGIFSFSEKSSKSGVEIRVFGAVGYYTDSLVCMVEYYCTIIKLYTQLLKCENDRNRRIKKQNKK